MSPDFNNPEFKDFEQKSSPVTDALFLADKLEYVQRFVAEPSLDSNSLKMFFTMLEQIKDRSKNEFQKIEPTLQPLYFNLLADTITLWRPEQADSIDEYVGHINNLQNLLIFGDFIEIDKEDLFEKIKIAEEEFEKFAEQNPDKVREYVQHRSENLENMIPRLYEHVESNGQLGRVQAQRNKVLDTLLLASNKVQRTESPGHIAQYSIESDGRWLFDLSPMVDLDDVLITVISAENPEVRTVVEFKKLLTILENDEFASFTNILMEKFEAESSGHEQLEGFDLPQDGEIAYMRVFPKNYDDISLLTVPGSALLAETIAARYQNASVQAPLFTEKPLDDIRRQVDGLYRQGVRNFFIDIFSHGSQSALQFEHPLTARDLATLSNSYPDAKFIFSTVGCHGGGLREGMMEVFKSRPELQDRVTLLLQTKPEFLNMYFGNVNLSTSQNQPQVSIERNILNMYQMALIQALQEGKTFGEALVEADHRSKQALDLDPENIIGGQLFTELNRPGTQTA